jgi:CBS domain containing-hemolysin-like protein
MINSLILILVVIITVVFSGLFAGAETGMYQLSRLRLRLGIEKKRLSFMILDKALSDSPALLLSILTGNNLTHYLATSIITYILLVNLQTEHTAELLATVLMAPVLFVFAELLPKSIFFCRADSLMPLIAPVLFGFHKLFSWCGITPLLKFISGAFSRLTGVPYTSQKTISTTQRYQIRALLRETHEENFLSSVQTDIINRLVNISNISIRTVMTPISKVQKVEITSDKPMLLKILKDSPYSRLLVYEQRDENIVGFINIYDCLNSLNGFTSLHDFVKPIRNLASATTVLDAINIMQKEGQKIVLVTRNGHISRKRPIGIVTMKDLVEELLGELAEW